MGWLKSMVRRLLPREHGVSMAKYREVSELAKEAVDMASREVGVLGIFRPKTTKCSGGHAVRGLQRGITFLALHIASHNKSIT